METGISPSATDFLRRPMNHEGHGFWPGHGEGEEAILQIPAGDGVLPLPASPDEVGLGLCAVGGPRNPPPQVEVR